MFTLLFTQAVFSLFLHPFHVSVCDIYYNEGNKSLDITHRIFLDDLEETLRIYSGNEKLDVMKEADKEEVSKWLKAYMSDNFSVSANGEPLSFHYLGEEREEDVMYCYIEITGVTRLSEIKVSNSLLMETFSDQSNLVHIKAFGKIRSLRLHANKNWGDLFF